MSESAKSPKSSTSQAPNAARPFSFRPQDFGAPERIQGTQVVHEVVGEEHEEVAPGALRAEQEPSGGASRVNTHARAPEDDDSHPVARKEEHTILMAVPPPAQVNKGS